MKKSDNKNLENQIKNLQGPILILGAGGFIGCNLFQKLLNQRTDVYGTSHNSKSNWRFKAIGFPKKNIIDCNVARIAHVKRVLQQIKPKTLFNLAAYGAYPTQKDYVKIYLTNVLSTVHILEILQKEKIAAYIHAGSQSEYGSNARAPKEEGELVPNSHYAISKISNYYAIKFYGKILHMPVVHMRIYSVYGPWEEPDRLIPLLVSRGRNGTYPPLVDASLSRDFVYVDDVVSAFISTAFSIRPSLYGEAFNVATGKKTTIRQITFLIKELCRVKRVPVFGRMKKREWDVKNWYGNNSKIQKVLHWKPSYSLQDGLKKTIAWQNAIQYDTAPWNSTKVAYRINKFQKV